MIFADLLNLTNASISTTLLLTRLLQELELILRASNISTTLPEPDLSSAASPQLTQLLLNKQLSQQQSPAQPSPQQQAAAFLLQKQQVSSLHELLKAPPGTSSETTAMSSSSVDSPRRMEDDDDCVIMDEWVIERRLEYFASQSC